MMKAGGFFCRKKNDWEDVSVTQINREPPHSLWEMKPQYSICLDGEWGFAYFDDVSAVPSDPAAFTRDLCGKKIMVPGNWELQGFGEPVYTNTRYPWDYFAEGGQSVQPFSSGGHKDVRPDPPNIPAQNPCGIYCTDFAIPEDWNGRDVFINFLGVETVFYFWINGVSAGYSQDSKLPAEFDISELVHCGLNLISVMVLRYSDASYMEDQDYWHLCGIFRSVRLYSKPAKRITDWKIDAVPVDLKGKGTLTADVKINRFAGYADHKVRVEVFGDASLASIASIASGEATVTALAQYRQYESPTSNTARISIDIDGVRLWSPDSPYLYKVVMTLLSPDGEILDTEYSRTGFRKIDVSNGIVELNGKRLIVKGVNRHEHDSRSGRTLSREIMLDEIICMKKLGINSVRTSHYPNDPLWYDLCDEYGLLLVAECNIETHGLQGELTHDPAWSGAFLERLVRMAVMYKNHPCIYSWSLGNESGTGANHAAMAGWIREYDPSRLCQYEAGVPGKNISDIRGNMYAPQDHIKGMIADPFDDRPVILIEFLYMIRNSGGGMHKFNELTDRFPRFQGGYIWDFKDKSIERVLDDGKVVQGYGGDFGESVREPYDPLFMTNNGIVGPKLELKPVAHEVRHVFSPVSFEAVITDNPWNLDGPRGRYLVKNRSFANLPGIYKVEYLVLENGVPITSGFIDLPVIEPGGSAHVDLKADFVKKSGCIYHAELILKYSSDTFYSSGDEEITRYQFLLDSKSVKLPGAPSDTADDVVSNRGDRIVINEDDFGWKLYSGEQDCIINRNTGVFSVSVSGRRLIADLASPCFSRPFSGVDGEKGWARAETWKIFSPDKTSLKVMSGRVYACDDHSVIYDSDIVADFEGHPSGALIRRSIRVFPDGLIDTTMFFTIDPLIGELPRIGAECVIEEGFEMLCYFGLGPHENYTDRRSSARIGLYETEVEKMHYPYEPPSECGGHEETSRISFSDDGGHRILIDSDIPFHFDAHHSSILHYREAAHDYELVRVPETYVHIDAAHAGIGGDMGWSTFLAPEDRVAAKNYLLNFRVKEVKEGRQTVLKPWNKIQSNEII